MSFITTDIARIQTAYETVRNELLKYRDTDGHWTGYLSDSALSTATAVSALSIYIRNTKLSDESEKKTIESLIRNGTDWLITDQNDDGGWGDTPKSPSNISTTLLVKCAILLSKTVSEPDLPENDKQDESEGTAIQKLRPMLRSPFHDSVISGWSMDVLTRADIYIRRNGGIAAISKRYGNDKTFSIPILTNAALAGLVPWRDVPPLPFELAAFPQSLFKALKMPVVSYAIPALVAIGRVIFENRPAPNILTKTVRKAVAGKTLEKIRKMQPESGGYLEATPLTAFVVMSLSACDLTEHDVVVNGLRFIKNSVRENGSWPIDTNLTTWVTSLSINALALKNGADEPQNAIFTDPELCKWLISCQHRTKHPFTGAEPGGWAWTDLSGGVPDADDTPGALLALSEIYSRNMEKNNSELVQSVMMGIRWLVSLQNRDGGWPTFCRGWNRFPFDRSGVDLTAHAIRALISWKEIFDERPELADSKLLKKMDVAINVGANYIIKTQNNDGSWLPLWFGNQYHPREENPIYGTAKVLLALELLSKRPGFEEKSVSPIISGAKFAVSSQNADGGWGCGHPLRSTGHKLSRRKASEHFHTDSRSGFEETSIVIDALSLFYGFRDIETEIPEFRSTIDRAVQWLVKQVEEGGHSKSSPIGLYFTKLWYDEKLYPLIFSYRSEGGW